jgi:hypothetical protein
MSLKVQCYVPGATRRSVFLQVNTNGNFSSNYRIDEVTKILSKPHLPTILQIQAPLQPHHHLPQPAHPRSPPLRRSSRDHVALPRESASFLLRGSRLSKLPDVEVPCGRRCHVSSSLRQACSLGGQDRYLLLPHRIVGGMVASGATRALPVCLLLVQGVGQLWHGSQRAGGRAA